MCRRTAWTRPPAAGCPTAAARPAAGIPEPFWRCTGLGFGNSRSRRCRGGDEVGGILPHTGTSLAAAPASSRTRPCATAAPPLPKPPRMTTSTPSAVLQQLNWRYATKRFDPTRQIPAEEELKLQAAIRALLGNAFDRLDRQA